MVIIDVTVQQVQDLLRKSEKIKTNLPSTIKVLGF